jgi:hypothetical protein
MSRRTVQAALLGLLLGSAAVALASRPGRQPPITDVTLTHGFKDAVLCSFQPGGERLFAGLEELRYQRSLRISREVGGLPLAIEGRRTSRPSPDGGSADEGTTVGAPADAIRWHGLQVGSFAVGYNRPPESDSLSWREVRLRASPVQVRAMLARLGVRVPPGGYHRINDDHPCGGAMLVTGKAGETSIRCEWGC